MSRPIRFVHVTTFYPPYHFGGDGVYVYRLAHALGDRGHLVDVVHCTDSYRLFAGGEPAARFADHENVTVHSLKSPFGWLSPLLSQQTGQPLLKRAALEVARAVAKGGARAFYEGRIAAEMAQTVQARGGFLSEQDLAEVTADWVEPIALNYAGYDVLEIPPNGQGITALILLGLMQRLGMRGVAPDSAGLLASSGKGELGGFAGSLAPLTTFELNFDNHLRLLKAI